MAMLFVVEDAAKDLWSAEDAARTVGFTSIIGYTSSEAALKMLSTMLSDFLKLPDAFLIDLDLGQDSGYEILRFRHATPKLSRIPALVWTRLDGHHQHMCAVFGITRFVDKGDGLQALREALAPNLSLERNVSSLRGHCRQITLGKTLGIRLGQESLGLHDLAPVFDLHDRSLDLSTNAHQLQIQPNCDLLWHPVEGIQLFKNPDHA